MKEITERYFKVRAYNCKTREWEDHFTGNASPWGGMDLISCLNCGQVYCFDSMHELCAKIPMDDLLSTTRCIKCDRLLSETAASYPDFFLGKEGYVGIRNTNVEDYNESAFVIVR